MPLDRLLRHLIAWQSSDGVPVPDRELPVEQARERYRVNAVRPDAGRSGPAVTSADRTIGGPDGTALRVRVYTPQPAESSGRRVVTFLHGGGWVLGDLDSHDRACRILAASLDSVVVAVEYRLAPEYRHPAPLHDAVAAARWTARIFPGRAHVIAGDSAGASLALGVALEARDLRFAAQLLVYPPVDPSLALASSSPHAEGYLLSVEDMAWNYGQYVPDARQRADLTVDLLNADLRNLAPTVVVTAEYDPLHEEGAELVTRMRAAGVPAHLVTGEGLVHGFLLMQDIVPAAAACTERAVRALDALLPGQGSGPGAGGGTE
ncbi:alpha/beta hydrolase [Streptomyces sp. NPDC089799]|uniref:alpha/beta hydrolase n=1 Tax=Streptomyces sp. NPDC089799 TaxID=3155066 RepID=UPI0034295364